MKSDKHTMVNGIVGSVMVELHNKNSMVEATDILKRRIIYKKDFFGAISQMLNQMGIAMHIHQPKKQRLIYMRL